MILILLSFFAASLVINGCSARSLVDSNRAQIKRDGDGNDDISSKPRHWNPGAKRWEYSK